MTRDLSFQDEEENGRRPYQLIPFAEPFAFARAFLLSCGGKTAKL